MKRYKVKEVIELLEKDGWELLTIKGDHRQYKHPSKKRKSYG
ncbi:MAG: type II toxin-antitoxin system HicA family toxin [Muribaculaceae bacterium]